MCELHALLLCFVRRGLWGVGCEGTVGQLSRGDWQRLFAMACRHSVSGLFVDGVARSGVRPDNDLWEQWVVHLFALERFNAYNEARGRWWTDRLGRAGISAEVFKGASVAQWYPVPQHRGFSDVDIVVGRGWERLAAVLGETGRPCRYFAGEVLLTDEGGLSVEFHRYCERVFNPVANRRLRRMTGGGGGMSPELYAACLIIHIRRHCLISGVGLKQVVDVAAMLRSAPLDMERLGSTLRRLHIARFSRLLFGFISVNVGGVSSFPLRPQTAGRSFVRLSSILLGGEGRGGDGLVDGDKCSPLLRILRNAVFFAKRGMMLARLMPAEAGCFLAYLAVRRVGRMVRHGRVKKE